VDGTGLAQDCIKWWTSVLELNLQVVLTTKELNFVCSVTVLFY